MGRKKTPNRKSRSKHEFESVTEFDQAMRKLVTVPKEAVEDKQRKARRKK